jgi:hypothetical protein
VAEAGAEAKALPQGSPSPQKQQNEAYRHGNSSLNNKPIIITFLAMEKVILLCIS